MKVKITFVDGHSDQFTNVQKVCFGHLPGRVSLHSDNDETVYRSYDLAFKKEDGGLFKIEIQADST